jgi:hypothetical protein
MKYGHDVQRWRNPCQSSCYGILVQAVTKLIHGLQHIDLSLLFFSWQVMELLVGNWGCPGKEPLDGVVWDAEYSVYLWVQGYCTHGGLINHMVWAGIYYFVTLHYNFWEEDLKYYCVHYANSKPCYLEVVITFFSSSILLCTSLKTLSLVRIRVRIDPPRPLVCRKRRLNGAVLRIRQKKSRSRVTIKTPPCSKALNAEHRPKFCSPSPATVTSSYKWKILEWDVMFTVNNQSPFVCLFSFESHEQFLSYLATVTISGDRAANFDLCLALTAFRSDGSFTCHTYCDSPWGSGLE